MKPEELVVKFNITDPEVLSFFQDGISFRQYLKGEITRLSRLLKVEELYQFSVQSDAPASQLLPAFENLKRRWNEILPPSGRGQLRTDDPARDASMFFSRPDVNKIFADLGISREEFDEYRTKTS